MLLRSFRLDLDAPTHGGLPFPPRKNQLPLVASPNLHSRSGTGRGRLASIRRATGGPRPAGGAASGLVAESGNAYFLPKRPSTPHSYSTLRHGCLAHRSRPHLAIGKEKRWWTWMRSQPSPTSHLGRQRCQPSSHITESAAESGRDRSEPGGTQMARRTENLK